MAYKVKLIPLSQLPVGPNGPLVPLCQSCINKDCQLPIETVQVSIFGVNKPVRVHSTPRRQSFVVECDGYMSDKGPQEEDNELRAITAEIQERSKGPADEKQ